jgi:hypothetical protein
MVAPVLGGFILSSLWACRWVSSQEPCVVFPGSHGLRYAEKSPYTGKHERTCPSPASPQCLVSQSTQPREAAFARPAFGNQQQQSSEHISATFLSITLPSCSRLDQVRRAPPG